MPTPPRVCILVLNDVVSDGRVQRTAQAAVARGLDVLVIGLRSGRAPDLEKRDGYVIARVEAKSTPRPLAELRTHAVAAPPPAAAAPPTTSLAKQAQAAYDEAVTFRIRQNRLYQVLNTYDKRMRRAVRRTFSASRASLPPPADALLARLADTGTWERTSRHMADHDAIRRDQLDLGDAMVAQALAFDPDLCHCNDLDTLLAGFRIKHACNAALVYDAHELWTEQHAPRRAREEHTEHFYGFYDELLTALAPFVDGAVTVNPSIAMVLESRCPALHPEVVWNCPARVDGPLPREGHLRALAGDRCIVLMHGGLIPMDRGLPELVSAAALTRNALFVFRGSGSARPDLERQAHDLGLLGTTVVFEDPVPLADVVKAGAEADLGVIPYKPTGINNLLSSPNKLFEYMASGLAVAASDLPELRRVITTEDAGVLFNPTRPPSIAQALNTLTTDPQRLAACRANARRAALDRYCWEVQAETLGDLYTRLLTFQDSSRSEI